MLYYVQQSPISGQVYVSPSSQQIFTPVAVSQLPQMPGPQVVVPQVAVPQVVVPQVSVPQVAVAQRPVIRVPLPQEVPQVSLLRVAIPKVNEVVQEPKVMVQSALAQTDVKNPVNRQESELISESLSDEDDESTSSEYTSNDTSDDDESENYETPITVKKQCDNSTVLQDNDDLAYAFQLQDVLNQDITPPTTVPYTPIKNRVTDYPSYNNQTQDDLLSPDEILYLYRQGEPVSDYINFYVAINPKQADQLSDLLENEVSGQSILQNVQQYYRERDPYLPVDDEFTIDYLTPSDDEDQENWSYED